MKKTKLLPYSLRILVILSLVLSSISALGDNFLQLEVVTKRGEGKVLIKLLPKIAPNHVKRIQKLTREGAYDNLAFHRVIPGFMVQTGDIQYGNMSNYNHDKVGTGESKYSDLYAELSEIPFEAGILGMARNRYINSANSQFFIMTGFNPKLNARYTVVGAVLEGLDFLKTFKAGKGGGDQGKVTDPNYIRKATLLSSNK